MAIGWSVDCRTIDWLEGRKTLRQTIHQSLIYTKAELLKVYTTIHQERLGGKAEYTTRPNMQYHPRNRLNDL